MFCLLELLGNTWIPKHIYNNLKHIYIYTYPTYKQRTRKLKLSIHLFKTYIRRTRNYSSLDTVKKEQGEKTDNFNNSIYTR